MFDDTITITLYTDTIMIDNEYLSGQIIVIKLGYIGIKGVDYLDSILIV
jgi:hypothetical protein